MQTKHVGTREVQNVIAPDVGETLTIRRDYPPWLLGFCRWSIVRQTLADRSSAVFTETLETGKWRWRGLRARYNDTVIDRGIV